jgi:hypothetical protein
MLRCLASAYISITEAGLEKRVVVGKKGDDSFSGEEKRRMCYTRD